MQKICIMPVQAENIKKVAVTKAGMQPQLLVLNQVIKIILHVTLSRALPRQGLICHSEFSHILEV